MMRVLGIDPGTVATGWGVIEVTTAPNGGAGSHRRVASGVIRAKGTVPARLVCIFAAVRDIVAEHRPEALSLEKAFVSDNVQSAFRLGEARGSILVAAAESGVEVYEYSPAEVKMAVVGYGRALKEQVQAMVTRLLSLPSPPAADEADALACALCHLQAHRLRGAIGEATAATRTRPARRRPSAGAGAIEIAGRRWRR
jgi:crossover junction endodeoxyribonuclease RuvC